MKPPVFEGSPNLLDAEDWLSSIEIIMDFMELSDHERVSCASYMFKCEARYWCESVRDRKSLQVMSWEDFVLEFNIKFFNPIAISAQQIEVLTLKQGSMTVVAIVQKFEQLA